MTQIGFGKIELNAMESMLRLELCPSGVWLEISPVVSSTLSQLESIFPEAMNVEFSLKQKIVREFIAKTVPDIRCALWHPEPIIALPILKCFANVGEMTVSICADRLYRDHPSAEWLQSGYVSLREIGDQLLSQTGW